MRTTQKERFVHFCGHIAERSVFSGDIEVSRQYWIRKTCPDCFQSETVEMIGGKDSELPELQGKSDLQISYGRKCRLETLQHLAAYKNEEDEELAPFAPLFYEMVIEEMAKNITDAAFWIDQKKNNCRDIFETALCQHGIHVKKVNFLHDIGGDSLWMILKYIRMTESHIHSYLQDLNGKEEKKWKRYCLERSKELKKYSTFLKGYVSFFDDYETLFYIPRDEYDDYKKFPILLDILGGITENIDNIVALLGFLHKNIRYTEAGEVFEDVSKKHKVLDIRAEIEDRARIAAFEVGRVLDKDSRVMEIIRNFEGKGYGVKKGLGIDVKSLLKD